MHYTIRKLTADDITPARELIHFFQVDDVVEHPVIPADHYLAELLSRPSFHIIVAMDEGGKVLGGLTAYELSMYKESVNEMFLYEIAVLDEYREQGIGKALIERLQALCRERGIPEMYVGTSTDNEPAKKLYAATGGVEDLIPWFVYQV